MTAEIIVPLSCIVLLLVLGLYLLQGKGGWLIAGYNTLPSEEKKKYDEAALCKATGKLILAITFTIALITAGDVLDMEILMISGIILMILSIISGIIYLNTGERFKKRTE
ncbi:DUF3784 domain-containing protein [Planococcus sp. CAU13]|uniref:DUF3784 domain-containing protein n=1 Tax=Planococcus sp. CAU13 TaxID=1541197 RepID=UPI00068A0AE8|nr:DUF3784 domain-containing protein [Planococcus sp. CAU13]